MEALPEAEQESPPLGPGQDSSLPIATAAGQTTEAFSVSLENFSGPFDLLLSLIARHQLDVTEVALAQVTDEFIAYINAQQQWDLSVASEFLVIAATLLELKAARLLPGGHSEEIEDLELLEARDLLFARLLQYKAYKEVAGRLRTELEHGEKSVARRVPLEPQFAQLLPDLVLALTPDDLARIAAQALNRPQAPTTVGVDHLHAPVVSVREQAALLVAELRRRGRASFRDLTADAGSLPVVIARFLALLELFREQVVSFDQVAPLADLTIRWVGAATGEVNVEDEFDSD